MNDTIQITLNGEPREVVASATVADLVATLEGASAAVATAVNGDFLARAARAQCRLQDGDALFIFEPVTGG